MDIALSLLRWWYSEGLMKQYKAARQSFAGTVDFFSITLLLKTLFAPFRQISSGKVRGPIGVQIRAILDKLISRLVGATIRSLTIIFGFFALIFSAFIGVVRMLIWVAMPVLPVVGLILFLSGWVPWAV